MACLAAPALAALTHAGVGRSRVQVVHVRVPVRVQVVHVRVPVRVQVVHVRVPVRVRA